MYSGIKWRRISSVNVNQIDMALENIFCSNAFTITPLHVLNVWFNVWFMFSVCEMLKFSEDGGNMCGQKE